MKGAVADVLKHNFSLRIAAERSGIKHQTLARYVKKAKEALNDVLLHKPHYDTRRVLNNEQELLLKNYIIQCSKMCYGKSTKDVEQLAYELCLHNKIHMPQKWEEMKSAGLDWLHGFKKRYPELSIRQPEGCSLSRATSFNRSNVDAFFRNLEEVLKRFDGFSEGTRIFNLDETSTTTVQKSSKILAPKGVNQINKITSGERGILVTTCCIITSTGTALPPVTIFPRVNFKHHMLNRAPASTLGLANPSGWMNSELFVDVMRHFIQHYHSSKTNPTLLILDNHESHFSIETLNLAKDNGVTMLTLPPHCPNKLQPLDVAVYAPFKTYYNSAMDSWIITNPGKPITIFQIAECVGYAFDKFMTPSNIKAGFKKCGIVPFNQHIFDESDFLISNVTDRNEILEERDTNGKECQPTCSKNLTNKEPGFHGNEETDEKSQLFRSPEQLLFGYPKAGPRKNLK
ncbi:uncharacterized protein LOC126884188 [Diabrotica virgifera virgifera]|uniref:DDE-1 domain-containing protein n=1 Tax=Diabrotica virgifera virgifera TaxID=50390 RepID=A0ABM5K730_DIAVI|nr:uncharacterized protein LOC126884188 [Diabrotica virgifera virgifera]